MASVSALVTEPYLAALDEDWERMWRFYEENRGALIYPLTVTNDTPFHMAVYSASKSPLQELLHIFPNDALIAKANDKKNTPLHEAGAIGNMEAAQLLVRFSPEQLEARNALGETPMFRAAAFGMTEMVKYLASEVRSRQCDMQIQRIRDDNTSILHSAIHGQHFEVALWLFQNDEILGNLVDNKGRTCLQLLANMKSAFKSGYPMCRFESFIYFCLPNNERDDKIQMNLSQLNDLESGLPKNHLQQSCFSSFNRAITGIYSSWWMFLAARWPMIDKIQYEKKKHESSWKLAKLLIKKDRSWEKTHTKPDIGIISFGEIEGSESEKEGVVGKKEERKGKNDHINPLPFPTTPLLIATSTGIEEIVNGILKEHPQAVEHVSDEGLNIMHVAIRHRQRNIFKCVKKMKIPMVRLVRKIDDNGYTLLHHVSDMTHYHSGGSLPNSALQLQDELKWFERVRKIIPSHYVMNHSKVNGQTAEDLFEMSHAELHKEAQSWLKRTSESCSVIAVLIATVAFTAAYTVPGGSDQITGLPILLHDPFFTVFTVMDVVSLVSSLTSVVMFISILTSPFRLQDFRKSLPRKLTLAFTFLFLSVASTMLAFSATVILIVHMKKRWTTTLVVYGVAFVPVTVFGLLQFPLYVAFMGTVKYSLTILKKALPWNFLRRLLFCNNPKNLFISKGK